MVEMLSTDVIKWEIYDPHKRVWICGTPSSMGVNVNVHQGPLQYRMLGVTEAPGLLKAGPPAEDTRAPGQGISQPSNTTAQIRMPQ